MPPWCINERRSQRLPRFISTITLVIWVCALWSQEHVHGFRILNSSSELASAPAAVFEPHVRGQVGHYGDPSNPDPERVNEGSPFSPDTPHVYFNGIPKPDFAYATKGTRAWTAPSAGRRTSSAAGFATRRCCCSIVLCKKYDPRCLVCDAQACLVCTDPLLNSVRRSGSRATLDAPLPFDELQREFSFKFSYDSQDPRVFDEAESFFLTPSSSLTQTQLCLNESSKTCVQGANADATWSCTPCHVSHCVCGRSGVVYFGSPTYAIAESARDITLAVRRSGGGLRNATVAYDIQYLTVSMNDVSPTACYTSSQVLFFDEGVVELAFQLTIRDDHIVEPNEIFRVVLRQSQLDCTTGGRAGTDLLFKIQSVLGSGAAKKVEGDTFIMESYAEGIEDDDDLIEYPGGLCGDYYGDAWLELGAASPVISRIDRHVNFTWGTDPIFPGASDYVAVRWSGRLKPRATGDTIFHVAADDHVRLWIDDLLLIDKWDDMFTGQASATIALDSSVLYAIVLEYRDLVGNARVHLSWSSASFVKEIIPASNLFSVQHIRGSPFYSVIILPTPAANDVTTVIQGAMASIAGETYRIEIFPIDICGNPRRVVDATNDGVEARLALTDRSLGGIGSKQNDAMVAWNAEKESLQATWTNLMLSGIYDLDVWVNGAKIYGSPFKVTITPSAIHPTRSVVTGNGLAANRVAGVVTTIVVEARDAYNNRIYSGGKSSELDIRALHTTTPSAIEIGTVIDNGDGTSMLAYTPRIVGSYNVRVMLNGAHINNSPYLVSVVPNVAIGQTSTASGTGLSAAATNVQASFQVTTRGLHGNDVKTGGATFQVVLELGAKVNLSCSCSDLLSGIYSCTYTAKYVGLTKLHVILSRSGATTAISGSPFAVDVVSGPALGSHCLAQGNGLVASVAGARANSTVSIRDTFDNEKRNAGRGTISVAFRGPAPATTTVARASTGLTTSFVGNDIFAVSFSRAISSNHNTRFAIPSCHDACAIGIHSRLNATYFNNPDLVEPSILRCKDATTDFDYGVTLPTQTDAMETFSVRWNGYLLPKYSEMFTFDVDALGGVSLSVNNMPLLAGVWPVANRTESPATTSRIYLTANQFVPFEINYTKPRSKSSERIRLFWGSLSQSREIFPPNRLFTSWKITNNVPTRQVVPATAHPPSFTAEFPSTTSSPDASIAKLSVGATAGEPLLFRVTARDQYKNVRLNGGDVLHVLFPQLLQDVTPFPIRITDLKNATYEISFSPIMSGPFSMVIAATSPTTTGYKGLGVDALAEFLRPYYIRQSPFTLNVEPNSAIAATSTITGEGFYQAAAGEEAMLAIQLRDFHSNPTREKAESAAFTPRVQLRRIEATGATGAAIVVSAKVSEAGDGRYEVVYTATYTGLHEVLLSVANEDAFTSKSYALRVHPNVASPLTLTISGGMVLVRRSAPTHSSLRGNNLAVVLRGPEVVYPLATYLSSNELIWQSRPRTPWELLRDNEWKGFIKPLYIERYTLQLDVFPAGALYIDQTPVIDALNTPLDPGVTSASRTVDLVRGRLHAITIEYRSPSIRELYGFIALRWQSDRQQRELVPSAALFPGAQEINPRGQTTPVRAVDGAATNDDEQHKQPAIVARGRSHDIQSKKRRVAKFASHESIRTPKAMPALPLTEEEELETGRSFDTDTPRRSSIVSGGLAVDHCTKSSISPGVVLPILTTMSPRTRQGLARLPPSSERDAKEIESEATAGHSPEKRDKSHATRVLQKNRRSLGGLLVRQKGSMAREQEGKRESSQKVPHHKWGTRDEKIHMIMEDVDVYNTIVPKESSMHHPVNETKHHSKVATTGTSFPSRSYQHLLQEKESALDHERDANVKVEQTLVEIQHFLPLDVIYAFGMGKFASPAQQHATQVLFNHVRGHQASVKKRILDKIRRMELRKQHLERQTRERKRAMKVYGAVIIIQKAFRKWQRRRILSLRRRRAQLEKDKLKIVKVQAHFRSRKARKFYIRHLLEVFHAIPVLRRAWRCYRARQFRSVLEMERDKQRQRWTVEIEERRKRHAAHHLVPQGMKKKWNQVVAVKDKVVTKGSSGGHNAGPSPREVQAAMKLQARWRGIKLRRRLRYEQARGCELQRRAVNKTRKHAAIRIQKRVRGIQGRAKAWEWMVYVGARRIQCAWRGFRTRRELFRMHKAHQAIHKMQIRWKERRNKETQLLRTRAARRIQDLARTFLGKRWLRTMVRRQHFLAEEEAMGRVLMEATRRRVKDELLLQSFINKNLAVAGESESPGKTDIRRVDTSLYRVDRSKSLWKRRGYNGVWQDVFRSASVLPHSFINKTSFPTQTVDLIFTKMKEPKARTISFARFNKTMAMVWQEKFVSASPEKKADSTSELATHSSVAGSSNAQPEDQARYLKFMHQFVLPSTIQNVTILRRFATRLAVKKCHDHFLIVYNERCRGGACEASRYASVPVTCCHVHRVLCASRAMEMRNVRGCLLQTLSEHVACKGPAAAPSVPSRELFLCPSRTSRARSRAEGTERTGSATKAARGRAKAMRTRLETSQRERYYHPSTHSLVPRTEAGKAYMKLVRQTKVSKAQRLKDERVRASILYKVKNVFGIAPTLKSDTKQEIAARRRRLETIKQTLFFHRRVMTTDANGVVTTRKKKRWTKKQKALVLKAARSWYVYDVRVKILRGEWKDCVGSILSTQNLLHTDFVVVFLPLANRSVVMNWEHIAPYDDDEMLRQPYEPATQISFNAASDFHTKLSQVVSTATRRARLLYLQTIEFRDIVQYAWVVEYNKHEKEEEYWNVVLNKRTFDVPRAMELIERMEIEQRQEVEQRVAIAKSKLLDLLHPLHSKNKTRLAVRRAAVVFTTTKRGPPSKATPKSVSDKEESSATDNKPTLEDEANALACARFWHERVMTHDQFDGQNGREIRRCMFDSPSFDAGVLAYLHAKTFLSLANDAQLYIAGELAPLLASDQYKDAANKLQQLLKLKEETLQLLVFNESQQQDEATAQA
ncbi:hypothetical protein FI667_g6141, partial [Globisporangium splendens]